jgi:integrase
MALTDPAIKNAKPKEKQYPLADGGGLRVLVHPNGSKYWQLRYRHPDTGKGNILGLGVYPALSLSQAREKAKAAKAELAGGVVPSETKRQAKLTKQITAANTFEVVAREWHTKKHKEGKWNQHHADRIWRRLELNVLPFLGRRPVAELETVELLYPLQLVEQRDLLTVAERLRQYITGIMRHAVQTGRIDTNPALDLQGGTATPKETNRPALPLERLPELRQRLDSYTGGYTSRHAMQFALLTCARSSEFRFARWPEFDLDRAEWVIPAVREVVEGVKHSGRGEKMGTARVIPLARQTVELLLSIQQLNNNKTFVFESDSRRGVPVCENTPNIVLRKLGYDTKKDICLHGFRTMACSSLNESGLWNRDAIERHMGHQERDKVRAAYQHKAEYLQERRMMLQWWADYLDAQGEGFIPATEFKQSGAVIYMAGRNRTA